MAYIYLLGVIVYTILWLVFFFLRKDLRRKLVVMSLLAAPLGIAEMLFIPGYWNPRFQAIPLLNNLFLESILFCLFFGGCTAVFYQAVCNEKLLKLKRINPMLTLIAPVLFMLYFARPVEVNVMVYAYVSMFIGAITTLFFLGKSASGKVIMSGIVSLVVYFIAYLIVWNIFPELKASYNFSALSGLLVFGIPVEEFLWIFSFALYWTPIYEIWKNYIKKR